MAKIISGTQIAEEIKRELVQEITTLKEKGITPGLAVVLVGRDPASVSYVSAKSKACQEVGIFSSTFALEEDVSQEEVLGLIEKLNNDPRFDGILVQLPLPKHINEKKVIEAISPEKDVDGLHPVNMGRLLLGEPRFIPATPQGVQQLLLKSGYEVEGKHVVICGRSELVGRPLAALLINKAKGANATVTICHTGTRDLAYFTRQAEILVVAIGVAEFIKADMVKEGAIVIDVGINRVPDPSKKSGFRLVGDVDFEKVKEKAEAITPVPGGVGPMTVIMLLWNTVKAAKIAKGGERC